MASRTKGEFVAVMEASDADGRTHRLVSVEFGAEDSTVRTTLSEEMLRYGSYPFYLKRRILSAEGHLSNAACAGAIVRFAERGTGTFLLAHLSRENNRPALALENARNATAGMDVRIEVLPVYGGEPITV